VEKYLTIKQLSEIMQISPRTLYEWTHIGFIPHYKFPKGVRFSKEKVEIWLKSRERAGRKTYKVVII